MTVLRLPRGDVALPAFFPDATRGAVRCAGFPDIYECGVRGLVMNAYHLARSPGRSVIKAAGGLNAFTGWDAPILTDSGGFQVFSLINENKKYGEVLDNRIIFRPDGGGKVVYTPEKCIDAQFGYMPDVMMCLDYCTRPDDSYEINKRAVRLTIKWARECKDEYLRKLDEAGFEAPGAQSKTVLRDEPHTKKSSGRAAVKRARPLLFAIIQGGNDRALRKECAEALADIGFDGYGYGGWPLDFNGRPVADILEYTASLMPDDKPKYAMGVGKPETIALCAQMGYNLFDCVAPTRDARHGRLYKFSDRFDCKREITLSPEPEKKTARDVMNEADGDTDARPGRGFYENYYPLDEKHTRDYAPVSVICDCPLCTNHSRAYLKHLFSSGDPNGRRLATLHNLRFYMTLMEVIRDGRG